MAALAYRSGGGEATERTAPLAAFGDETLRRKEETAFELCECMTDIAAELFNVPSKEIRRPGRAALSVARVRQIAMYVTHVALGLSMAEVGRGFGRDRTTVQHACHVIEDLRDDAEFDAVIARIERIAGIALRSRIGG